MAVKEDALLNDSLPRYAQIQKDLEQRLIDGAYPIGSPMPSEQVIGSGQSFEQLLPGGNCHCRVAAEAARPVRMKNLYRAVNGVGTEDGLSCAMEQTKPELPRRVSGQRDQGQAGSYVKSIVHKLCKASLDDRHDAVAEAAVIVKAG